MLLITHKKNMQVNAKSRKVHRASVSRGTYNFTRKPRELRQKSEELTTTNSANANANTNRAQSELTRAVCLQVQLHLLDFGFLGVPVLL